MSLTMGADVETFVRGSTGIISVTGMIPGSKLCPMLVPCGNLQEDNALAEFAIDIAHNEQEFSSYISNCMDALHRQLSKYACTPEIIPSNSFDSGYLRSLGAAVTEFGCQPEINAYLRRPFTPPDASVSLRTAGGHIHFGYAESKPIISFDIIKLMDILLGLPSIVIDRDYRRRAMYGKAGACRMKLYGGEYRVLSNFWIKSPSTVKWVYKQTETAVQQGVEGLLSRYYNVVSSEEVQEIINLNQINKAQELITLFNISMPEA